MLTYYLDAPFTRSNSLMYNDFYVKVCDALAVSIHNNYRHNFYIACSCLSAFGYRLEIHADNN